MEPDWEEREEERKEKNDAMGAPGGPWSREEIPANANKRHRNDAQETIRTIAPRADLTVFISSLVAVLVLCLLLSLLAQQLLLSLLLRCVSFSSHWALDPSLIHSSLRSTRVAFHHSISDRLHCRPLLWLASFVAIPAPRSSRKSDSQARLPHSGLPVLLARLDGHFLGI